MKVLKWNEVVRDYEEVNIPNDWNTPLYTDNMKEVINCVNCGKKLTFGQGYTSLRYHNHQGFGYYECEECYYSYYPIYKKYKEKE